MDRDTIYDDPYEKPTPEQLEKAKLWFDKTFPLNLIMSQEPKPNREQGEGSEAWMARAFQAGATMEEVADVLALSVLFDRPCEQIKNIIVDAQVRARFGARGHVKRFGHDLKRLAGDPPGHAEVMEGKSVNSDSRVIEIVPGLDTRPVGEVTRVEENKKLNEENTTEDGEL